MDESAVHGQRLFQWPQLFLEVLHERFRRSAATANRRLCRVLGCQCSPVLWVCGAADVAAPEVLVLHWDHHVAAVLE
jgi:hypothetical protein